MYNFIGSGGVNYGHPGVLLNAEDQDNYDFVYFRFVAIYTLDIRGKLSLFWFQTWATIWIFQNLLTTIAVQGGWVLRLIFAKYVLLVSQRPCPIIVYFVANYRPHLTHFWANIIVAIPTYLCMYLILNEEHFTFHLQYKHSGTFANPANELSHPKNPKMCDAILETPLKMQSYYSQSRRENATPSSGPFPLTSYEEVTSRSSVYGNDFGVLEILCEDGECYISWHVFVARLCNKPFNRICLILCIVSFYFPGLIHPADVFRRVTFTKVNQNLTEQSPPLAPTVPPREQNGSTSGW